ncbi:MAG: hypothetical protein FWD89_02125 [Firmicutes bacterium]|nr:hypothetical protein [Bacillota bacterium]
MKKILEKIISVSLACVSLIFVVFLLVMIFNTNAAAEADNKVVHSLFIVFTLVFIALTAINIRAAFSDEERINQVLLYKTTGSSKKASVGVVRRLAKRAVKDIAGAKVRHVHLYVDENHEVTFRASVKVVTDQNSTEKGKAVIILEKVNAAIAIACQEVLGLEFKEIELKLVSAKSDYKPDAQAVAEKAEAAAEATEVEEETK